MKIKKIPTIIALLILFLGLASGIFLIRSNKTFKLGADETSAPKNVRVSNISDTSFTVSWTTQKETSGFIVWGDNPSSLKNVEQDSLGDTGYVHYTSTQGLAQQKKYYFKINSQGYEYDNNGIAWEVEVPSALNFPPPVKPISGDVLDATGSPASNVVVFASIGGAQLLSTTTSPKGTYIIPISLLRTSALNGYYNIDETNDVIEISVQAGPLGVASAEVNAESARPSPSIILGQTHDFKNMSPVRDGPLPEADLSAPSLAEKSSRFDVPESLPQEESENVTITSVTEGETITTQKPQFFGEGPAGVDITITVESDPVTDSVKVNNVGTWKWTPPSTLEPGLHTVTLAYRDENGILQKIIRNFVVSAAEGPAFEATPSATPAQTPASTPTSTPSSTPTTLTTTTPTAPPTPQSGISFPLILMISAGILMLIVGSGVLVSTME